MILLSALLASLTGLVAGERQPVGAPAQVHASSVLSAAQSEAVVAVARVQAPALAGPVASRGRQSQSLLDAAPQPRLRTRLALEQSWLK